MTSEFRTLPLSPDLLKVVSELGYAQMTPVQEKSIPLLLDGKDLIGKSVTGSGKTAAFALPLLNELRLDRKEVQALVLCPTRELCAQVSREIRKLGRRHPGLQVRSLSGGEPIREQTQALRKGVHIVVGTPGRTLDHLKRGNLNLSTIKQLVLDEADRMLEMGFSTELDGILAETPEKRQTVFFSATFPESIEELSRIHQKNAARVTVESSTNDSAFIEEFLRSEDDDKLDALCAALLEHEHESAIIFCNFKRTVGDVERQLHLMGASVDSLHGDLEQHERDRVMALFRNKSIRLLVATDVAARGIDVTGLDLVVNLEIPNQAESYVHRIGRTGRAGHPGLSVSLVSRSEERALAGITELTGRRPQFRSWQVPKTLDALRRTPLMETIRIAGGRKDKVRPGDILGALTGEAGGLDAKEIGKIEIHDRHAYVAVAFGVSRKAAKSLDQGRIKGRRFRASIVH